MHTKGGVFNLNGDQQFITRFMRPYFPHKSLTRSLLITYYLFDISLPDLASSFALGPYNITTYRGGTEGKWSLYDNKL